MNFGRTLITIKKLFIVLYPNVKMFPLKKSRPSKENFSFRGNFLTPRNRTFLIRNEATTSHKSEERKSRKLI